jgi:sRNA-binding carbon storage regulator CsrA
MLVRSTKVGEPIRVESDIQITVLDMRGLGIEALPRA